MSALNVHYSLAPGSSIAVGQLALYQERIYFEYTSDFLSTGLELSPFNLPLKAGAVSAEAVPWGGLFGLFNDSLPDGWGLLLMNRHLRSLGVETRYLTPLDRLAYMGNRTMGALTYEPARDDIADDSFELDVGAMASNAINIYEGRVSDILPQIAQAGGSPAGVCPKILVHLCDDRMISGEAESPEGFDPWIIKFFPADDHPDTGRIEYAYSLMAQDAGIDMPETRLFYDNNGKAWFGIKRFDREGQRRIHMHTLGGLLNADFRLPSLDYIDVLKATQTLTRNAADVERAFVVMAFNVLAHNRDDHSKNFSFLMDESGAWRLAPAYDLTCSNGINGEHTSAIAGEGKDPAEVHMLRVGESVGLKPVYMKGVIERVQTSISRWSTWCNRAGITPVIKFPPLA
ncbi:MAG: type II toxin-antitoxin system HipA family toxin [Gammaproteobacteria bacterium]|nr:type II toxin-antitoxin system HipA family toxin [Gammaproteobacteria bacterium]